MRSSAILSTGSFVPENFVHNEDLSQFPDTAKYLISQKTGVFSRRIAGEDECTSDLAVQAAKKCLEKIAFPAEKLESIIVATSSPDRIQPATATRVQHQIGSDRAFAFDINSVCAGSTYGIALADSLIKSGQCGNVLLIASEVYSKFLNKKDFSTFPYFGDGAGAILFQAHDSLRGVLQSCLWTDGSHCDTICVPGGGTMMPFEKMKTPNLAYFKMDGKTVFHFAVNRGAEVILQVVEKAGVMLDEIKCFVCHQANLNIIHTIAEKIEVSVDRFFVNLFRYGNMASASVPIALDEAVTMGFIAEGDLVVTVAFGGGLSWGANLIRF
jgi:3-oxoacyl-[acyl-carrier-protein] synthase-3